jgi:hypothetical protein
MWAAILKQINFDPKNFQWSTGNFRHEKYPWRANAYSNGEHPHDHGPGDIRLMNVTLLSLSICTHTLASSSLADEAYQTRTCSGGTADLFTNKCFEGDLSYPFWMMPANVRINRFLSVNNGLGSNYVQAGELEMSIQCVPPQRGSTCDKDSLSIASTWVNFGSTAIADACPNCAVGIGLVGAILGTISTKCS